MFENDIEASKNTTRPPVQTSNNSVSTNNDQKDISANHNTEQNMNSFIEEVLNQVQKEEKSKMEEVPVNTTTIRLNQSIFEVVNTNTDILGKGSYGIVYAGIKRSAQNTVPVAIKINDDPYLIEREIKLYNYLWYYKRNGYVPQLRIPRLLWEGHDDNKDKRAMVLEQLGLSLDKLFDHSNKSWNYDTVCWVAYEALNILKQLHSLGIVHRDIKPDNFSIGSEIENKSKLYIFDFGLSAQFRDTNGVHRPCMEGLSLIGTMRYSSVHNHRGILQSRRDDLESLGYVLLYFLNGTVSWKKYSSIASMDRIEMNKIICSCKEDLDCSKIASPFGEFIHYSRSLGYEDEPDYDTWIKVFQQLLSIHTSFFVPDWLIMPQLPDAKVVNKISKTLRRRNIIAS